MEATEVQKRRKTDKVELSKRIRIIQDWILQDHVTMDIINQSMNMWKINERQAYRYLWAAKKFFEEKDTTSIQRKVAYYIARKKKLLREMSPEEKKSAAGVAAVNRVLDSMAKLEGVTMETIKLIGDPERPVVTKSEVSYTSSFVDYTKLPTEFLEQLVNSRGAD